MTPAEHYAEAERLLGEVTALGPGTAIDTAMLLLSCAEVHATLATAAGPPPPPEPARLMGLTLDEWRRAAALGTDETRERDAAFIERWLTEPVGPWPIVRDTRAVHLAREVLAILRGGS